MSKPISQREARRLRKRVAELELQDELRQSLWSSDYPGGVHMATLNLKDLKFASGKLVASAQLGCALVAKIDVSGDILRIYAVPK